jgi:hypothetical protein
MAEEAGVAAVATVAGAVADIILLSPFQNGASLRKFLLASDGALYGRFVTHG